MRKSLIIVAFIASSVASSTAFAGGTLEGVRVWEGPDSTRVVFDLSGPVEHSIFSLENPDRIVVDLAGTRLAAPLVVPESGRRIAEIRSAPRDRDDLRVVFDLSEKLKPKSFLVKPNGEYGHRLVLDLESTATGSKPEPVKQATISARELLIAIDAGHGGEDPGALGRHGTREKDVVLQIARELARQINAEPGMRAMLIRDGDYYLKHADRREKARRERADMFISIHADGFPDPRPRGASVYALSTRGATSEAARILAERENASDLVGGVSLSDKDDVLASVLVDLSQTATLSASLNAGRHVLGAIKNITKVHQNTVQQAGFIVLKSPDVPSILVETGFISNPDEERKLKDRHYHRQLAGSIVSGVRTFFHENPPPGTLLAAWQGRGGATSREHAVRRGETLSGIAQRYKVSVQILRQVNGKSDDMLRVGEKLRIPLGS